MFVFLGRYRLACPQCFSLKDKRRIRYRIMDRLKARYNVSLIESGLPDEHQVLELGLALVHQEEASLRNLVLRLEEDLYHWSPGPVRPLEREIF